LNIKKSIYDKSGKITPVIIAQLSRSIGDKNSEIGIIYKFDDDESYRVVFPNKGYQSYGNYFDVSDEGKIIRFNELYVPKLNNPKTLILRAFVANNSSAIGSMYLTFDEIKNLSYVLSYSNEVQFQVEIGS
jgi:hypothetical protein